MKNIYFKLAFVLTLSLMATGSTVKADDENPFGFLAIPSVEACGEGGDFGATGECNRARRGC